MIMRNAMMAVASVPAVREDVIVRRGAMNLSRGAGAKETAYDAASGSALDSRGFARNAVPVPRHHLTAPQALMSS
jgi:hypothetical protein